MNFSDSAPAIASVLGHGLKLSFFALAVGALLGGGASAQEARSARQAAQAGIQQDAGEPEAQPDRDPRSLPLRSMACPQPVSISLSKNSGPATPYVPDMPTVLQTGGLNGGITASTFNHTQIDKWFGHTFYFKPAESKCCAMQAGRLTVTYRALASGLNVNDGSAPSVNGAPYANYLPGHIWPQGNPVAAGQMTTKSYVIPPNIMATGRVSFYAQDDTAVVSATLTGSGCCLEPSR